MLTIFALPTETTTDQTIVTITTVFVCAEQNIARVFSRDTKKSAFFCSLPLALKVQNIKRNFAFRSFFWQQMAVRCKSLILSLNKK